MSGRKLARLAKRRAPMADPALASLEETQAMLGNLLGPWFEKGRRVTATVERVAIPIEAEPGDGDHLLRSKKGDLIIIIRAEKP